MEQLKIFVINLANSSERRNLIAARLNELNCDFELFEAIDGREKSHPLFDRYDDRKRKRHRRRKLSGGELGCWASHYLLWEKCVELNRPIVVMEDDVEIKDSFRNSLDVANVLIAQLGFLRLAAIYNRAKLFLGDIGGCRLVRFLRGPAGTQCYIVSPVAAKNFLYDADVWYLAVDEYMDRFWQHGVDSFALMPLPVIHGHDGSDIVRLDKDSLSIFLKLKYELKKIKEQFLRVIYNFKHKSEIDKLINKILNDV